MGKLIRNGIEYGGGNGTDIFEVTQSEYNALKQAGTLVHNALYVITDAPNLNATASDIEYSSGVTVKQAIDSVVESGSNANGNYIKYADGTMICTKSEAIEILQSQWVAWGTMQNVGGVSVGSWAEPFYSTPIVNATISGDSAWLEKTTNFTTTSCGTVGFVRPNNPGRTTNFNVQIIAIGRWKA